MSTNNSVTSIAASNSMNSPLTTGAESISAFTRFPDVPAELRLKIWEEALPEARIVEMFNEHLLSTEEQACYSKTSQGATGLMRVNKESRDVFLRIYAPFVHAGEHNSYINVSKDILFIAPFESSTGIFGHSHFWLRRKELLVSLKEVRSLAILVPVREGHPSVPWSFSLAPGKLSPALHKLLLLSSQLTELIIVQNRYLAVKTP